MKIVSFLMLGALIISLSNCSIQKKVEQNAFSQNSKDLIGHYKILKSFNFAVFPDSSIVRFPRLTSGIIVAKRKNAYFEIPYQGDGGLSMTKDGTPFRFVRKGKWRVTADTLYLNFSEANKKYNSSYKISGDTLTPIIAPEKTIWIKDKDKSSLYAIEGLAR